MIDRSSSYASAKPSNRSSNSDKYSGCAINPFNLSTVSGKPPLKISVSSNTSSATPSAISCSIYASAFACSFRALSLAASSTTCGAYSPCFNNWWIRPLTSSHDKNALSRIRSVTVCPTAICIPNSSYQTEYSVPPMLSPMPPLPYSLRTNSVYSSGVCSIIKL